MFGPRYTASDDAIGCFGVLVLPLALISLYAVPLALLVGIPLIFDTRWYGGILPAIASGWFLEHFWNRFFVLLAAAHEVWLTRSFARLLIYSLAAALFVMWSLGLAIGFGWLSISHAAFWVWMLAYAAALLLDYAVRLFFSYLLLRLTAGLDDALTGAPL